MPENIIDDYRSSDNQQENTQSEEENVPTELEDFDVDDFTRFMDGVEPPSLAFDHYIDRDAKVIEEASHGSTNKKRKHVKIEGETYPYFYRGLINELHRGDAPIVFIHGKRRSGKSVALARLLYDLTNRIGTLGGTFTPKEQICYDVESFLKFHVNNVRKGLVLEEAGQNLNTKDWYSKFNRSAYEAFEVLGVMNLLTVLASTDHGDVDSDFTKRDKWKIVCEDRPVIKDGETKSPPVFKVQKFEYEAGTEEKELKDGFPKDVCKWSPEIPPDRIMKNYREKELQHKYSSIKERIEELGEDEDGGRLSIQTERS